jgi:hypothetical protein
MFHISERKVEEISYNIFSNNFLHGVKFYGVNFSICGIMHVFNKFFYFRTF